MSSAGFLSMLGREKSYNCHSGEMVLGFTAHADDSEEVLGHELATSRDSERADLPRLWCRF